MAEHELDADLIEMWLRRLEGLRNEVWEESERSDHVANADAYLVEALDELRQAHVDAELAGDREAGDG